MKHIVLQTTSNTKKTIPYDEETTILEVLSKHGVFFDAICGGVGRCGKCRVKVHKQEVLACLTNLTDGMEVTLVEYPHLSKQIPVLEYESILVLDIGTTTCSLAWVEVGSKEVQQVISFPNPQRSMGLDVMSRIHYAKNHSHLDLQSVMLHTIRQHITKSKSINDYETMIVVGNMVMVHLLLGISPESMGVAPYRPVFLEEKRVSGDTLGLPIQEVIVLPSLSAFIGADVVIGYLKTALDTLNETTLYMDIGTNGEMILHHLGYFYATSAAMGPALEGAEITQGMALQDGAITNAVYCKDKWILDHLGDTATGFAGSGILSGISEARKNAFIEKNGRIGRLNKTFDKITLAPNIHITQEDIRAVQLAKGAFATAVGKLLTVANVRTTEVTSVVITGSFGTKITEEILLHLGFVPISFQGKLSFMENGALLGAIDVLKNGFPLKRYQWIKEHLIMVELTNDPHFIEDFAMHMALSSWND